MPAPPIATTRTTRPTNNQNRGSTTKEPVRLPLTDYSSERIRGVDGGFTIKHGRERLKTNNYWAVFRVKKDPRRNDEYIDVLVGSKGQEETRWKVHAGINFDQSRRFVESRDHLVELRRQVESKLKGRLADETIVYSNKRVRSRFTFKVIIDEPTKTITPIFEEASLEELE
jgi:hypothetical protein